MKKIIVGVLLTGIVVSLTSSLYAAKVKTFVDLEMFLPANVYDGLETNVKNAAQEVVDAGCDSASYKIETTAALGARVGVLFPIENFGDIGVSIGYIAGPNSETKMTFNSTVSGNATMNVDRKLTFTRVLGEFKKDIPINDNWSFKPGVGFGMAFGKSKETVTSATAWLASMDGDSYAKSWNGFTWEVSPTFTRKYNTVDLNLALKYVGFPKLKENDNVSKIDWSTLGFSIGLGF